MIQLILEFRQLASPEILVERIPGKEDAKLYTTELAWEDLRGLF